MLIADLTPLELGGIIVSILASAYAAYSQQQKTNAEAKLEQKRKENDVDQQRLDYLFNQHRMLVEQSHHEVGDIRREVDELRSEHATCREELAAVKARLSALEGSVS